MSDEYTSLHSALNAVSHHQDIELSWSDHVPLWYFSGRISNRMRIDRRQNSVNKLHLSGLHVRHYVFVRGGQSRNLHYFWTTPTNASVDEERERALKELIQKRIGKFLSREQLELSATAPGVAT